MNGGYTVKAFKKGSMKIVILYYYFITIHFVLLRINGLRGFLYFLIIYQARLKGQLAVNRAGIFSHFEAPSFIQTWSLTTLEFPEPGRNNEILSAQRERGAWQGKFYWVNQNHAIALYNKHDRQDNLTHSLHLVTRYECRIFYGN